MPVLNNSQHEKFARLVASGRTATKAYILAGYSAVAARQNAHRLTTNDDISMRVLELQTELGNRVAAGRRRMRLT